MKNSERKENGQPSAAGFSKLTKRLSSGGNAVGLKCFKKIKKRKFGERFRNATGEGLKWSLSHIYIEMPQHKKGCMMNTGPHRHFISSSPFVVANVYFSPWVWFRWCCQVFSPLVIPRILPHSCVNAASH